jgi:hypothetical protein
LAEVIFPGILSYILNIYLLLIKQAIKASLLWGAEKRVFHAVEGLPGEAHEMNTLLPLVDSVRVGIREMFADRGFSSRGDVRRLTSGKSHSQTKVCRL